MTKRIFTVALWFFVGWVLGSYLAWTNGLSALLAPVVALALGALVAWNPGGRFLARPPKAEAPFADQPRGADEIGSGTQARGS